jgi:ketosteroid isomerase-like protein
VSQLTTDDRLAIAETMAAYCAAIDFGRWETLPDMFTDDCVLDFGAAMGRFEGHAGVRRFAEILGGMGLFMRHFNTNLVIRGDGERAETESYVLAITGPAGGRATTTGRYDDEWVKAGGRWRLRVRRALLDT